MDMADPPNPVSGQQWEAIVIHPRSDGSRLVDRTGNVFIPELVLKAMFSGRYTLHLRAYTGESAMGIMDYIDNMKQLHGVGRPRTWTEQCLRNRRVPTDFLEVSTDECIVPTGEHIELS